MDGVKRLAFALPALLATVALTDVIATGILAVLKLREYGRTDYPLVAPLNIVPAGLIACSLWAIVKGRNGASAALGTIALIISLLFWISQASGRAG